MLDSSFWGQPPGHGSVEGWIGKPSRGAPEAPGSLDVPTGHPWSSLAFGSLLGAFLSPSFPALSEPEALPPSRLLRGNPLNSLPPVVAVVPPARSGVRWRREAIRRISAAARVGRARPRRPTSRGRDRVRFPGAVLAGLPRRNLSFSAPEGHPYRAGGTPALPWGSDGSRRTLRVD